MDVALRDVTLPDGPQCIYLDASALVKRYVAEAASAEVAAAIDAARLLATAVVSRADVTSALAKAVRLKLASRDAAAAALADCTGAAPRRAGSCRGRPSCRDAAPRHASLLTGVCRVGAAAAAGR